MNDRAFIMVAVRTAAVEMIKYVCELVRRPGSQDVHVRDQSLVLDTVALQDLGLGGRNC